MCLFLNVLCVTVEQSSRRHYISFIIDSVLAKTENTFISLVMSGHYYVACL